MKKLTSILLALVLVFSFAACSNNSSDNSNTTPSTSQTTNAPEDTSKSTDENTQNSNTSSKILVVYYSATGSTKAVAETIADTSEDFDFCGIVCTSENSFYRRHFRSRFVRDYSRRPLHK